MSNRSYCIGFIAGCWAPDGMSFIGCVLWCLAWSMLCSFACGEFKKRREVSA